MSWIDWLRASDMLIGIVVATAGLVFAALRMWDKRSRSYVDHAKDDLGKEISNTSSALERRLNQLETAVKSVVEERFKAGSERMDRHDQRLLTLETKMAELPRQQDMHNLELQLTEVVGTLREMSATMDGHAKVTARQEVVVSRLEDHLLQGKGK